MPSVLPYIFFTLGIGIAYLFRFFPILTIFLSLLILILINLKYKSKKLKILCLIILLFSFSYALVRMDCNPLLSGRGILCKVDKNQELLALNTEISNKGIKYFSGIIADLPVTLKKGYLQEIHLKNPEIPIKTYLISPHPFIPGSKLYGRAMMKIIESHDNPGSGIKEPALFLSVKDSGLLEKGYDFKWLPQRLRWKLYVYFKSHFSPDVTSLLSEIIIGHKDSNSDMLYTAYAKAGLAHLMSISGTHFSLISLLLFALLRYSAWIMPYKYLVKLTSRLSLNETAILLTFPLIIFYLFLSGGQIPAVRSFIMINIFFIGLFIGRKKVWIHSILFAATVILLIDPSSLRSISFQLSFMAVLSIGFAVDFIEKTLPLHHIPATVQGILKIIVVTLSALIGTTPLVLYYFHYVSLISLPTNLIFVPVICFLILPLSLFGSVTYFISGYFPFAEILQILGHAVNLSVIFISKLYLFQLLVKAFPAFFLFLVYPALYLVMRIRWKEALICIACLFISLLLTIHFSGKSNQQVTFLDVGQGDSTVIETPEGKTIVVDTGNNGKNTLNYLRYRGTKKVDALILSQSDYDHSGGMQMLLNSIRVSEIWDNGMLQYKPQISKNYIHRQLRAGDVIKEDNLRILVLHPKRDYYDFYGSNENNYSLVLRFQYRDLSILFPGDIESDAENSLIHLKEYLKSDVLKIAHHGSKTSSTQSFLNTVNPSVAIISVGRGNSYGHPHEETLKRLSGIKVYRTDVDGAVKVSLNKNNKLQVKRYKDYKLQELRGLNLSEELSNLKKLFFVW